MGLERKSIAEKNWRGEPCLAAPPFSAVWHWAHFALKSFAPLAALPSSGPGMAIPASGGGRVAERDALSSGFLHDDRAR